MSIGMSRGASLAVVDSLSVDVITDNVSDAYVSKTLFAVSEFANVVLGGAKVISGETLLAANLGYGLRLRSRIGDTQHVLLFDAKGRFSSAIAATSHWILARSRRSRLRTAIGFIWGHCRRRSTLSPENAAP